MPAAAEYMNLPFNDAIAFMRQKVNLPTKAWDDLWGGMHSRAFTIAGATKAELLCDMRQAVDKAISQGTTLAEFRKDFDRIVSKHGWKYKGGRGWRTSVIYDTNLSVAYSVGRYKQMSSPAVLAVRPYLRYLPSTSAVRNEDHVRWYNLVLPHDDPFWKTHYPPNDWGCKCGVTSMSKREMERMQKDGEQVHTTAPAEETYTYINKKTGEELEIPVGIGPGWDYHPGRATWGQQLSKKTMDEFRATKGDAWEILTPGNWEAYGLAKKLVSANPVAKIGKKFTTKETAVSGLEEILGDKEKIFSLIADDFRYDLVVNAETLIDHMDLSRTPYLPFLPETLTDPQEVWLRFDKHKGTGKVILRTRIIKTIALGKKKTLLVVCEARNGWIEAWTLMPVSGDGYVEKQRSGKLIYWKD